MSMLSNAIPRLSSSLYSTSSNLQTSFPLNSKYISRNMECLTNSWFLESGMNQFNHVIGSVENNQIWMDDFLSSIDDVLGEDFHTTFDPSTFLNVPTGDSAAATTLSGEPSPFAKGQQVSREEPPPLAKRQKIIAADRASTVPIILNFGDKSSPESGENLNPDEEEAISQVLRNENKPVVSEGNLEAKNGGNKISRDKPPSQTYDHIISERKRRKLLSEQFLALSGMVPGLKRMDKTSVLGEAIKYLKGLQERVETLEEKLTKETVESAVLVRKSQIMVEGEEGSPNDDDSSSNSYKQPLPEIEAKVCNNQALLRIHCEKQKGVMVKILAEIEKLSLSVLHSNVSPFGNLALDITIMVEMDKEYTPMANQIVQALHSALRSNASNVLCSSR